MRLQRVAARELLRDDDRRLGRKQELGRARDPFPDRANDRGVRMTAEHRQVARVEVHVEVSVDVGERRALAVIDVDRQVVVGGHPRHRRPVRHVGGGAGEELERPRSLGAEPRELRVVQLADPIPIEVTQRRHVIGGYPATRSLGPPCQRGCLWSGDGYATSRPSPWVRSVTVVSIAVIALAAGLTIGVLGALLTVARRRAPDERGLREHVQLQAGELRRIADQGAQRDLASEQLRQGLEGARRALEELRTHEQDRRATDGEQREVVRRLATVLAGGASKGRAGEFILREHLAELPPGMLVTDFRVNGKVVEFALLLPDGRRLPIDSKWSAVAELEALESARDAAERDACARAVERAVTARAKEVAQYLDPAVTAPVAVAAVPDAAYRVLKRAHADAYAKGVIIVPYGSALPIVLFLYSLVRRFGDAADVQA